MASSGLRTTFREALQAALAASLQIEFQGGPIEGPQADRDIGCVWWDGKRPHPRDGNNEESVFQVRVLRRFQQDQGGEVPRADVAARLELTAEQLEDALYDVLTMPLLAAATGADLSGWQSYFNVTEVVTNYPGQYVQATIAAQARNRTARGG